MYGETLKLFVYWISLRSPSSPLSIEVSPTNKEQIYRLIMNRYKRSSAECQTKPSETKPFTGPQSNSGELDCRENK